jgi:fumarate reductase subunit C
MSEAHVYTEYHPRWHRTRMSTWWWLKKGAYLVFILRELSSAFIAWFVVFTLLQVRALSQGGAAWNDFLVWAKHPLVVLLNLVSLFFVVFHAVTWFNLAPKAMVLRFRGQRVPAKWILIANLAAWAGFSLLVALIVLW